MNAEDKNKEVDIDEVAMSIEVSPGVIDRVRSGEVTHIVMQLGEDNQNDILETVDGHLILVVDETPTTYHVCYLYNHGEFPYVIKLFCANSWNGDGADCPFQLSRIRSAHHSSVKW